MITQIYNYNGKSYTIRLRKSVQSFLTEQNIVDTRVIEIWRTALGCDEVVCVNRDQFLFLNRIDDAELL